jgi:hypothetical protein
MEYRTSESGLRPGQSGPEPPGQGELPAVTGEPSVDAALARLDELPGLPVTEHCAVFEQVHKSLTDVLGELDTGLPSGARAGADPGVDGGTGGAGKADRHRG